MKKKEISINLIEFNNYLQKNSTISKLNKICGANLEFYLINL